MAKRKAKRQAKRRQAQQAATQEQAGCSFHVLSYAVSQGKELAVCLDCPHTESWVKGA